MKKATGRLEYGWVVVGAGFLVVAGALGLGRFAYGIVLPSMQAGLELSHRQTGLIASANMSGYFLAAVVAGLVASRVGPRVVIVVSMLWVSACMLLTGLAGGFASLLFLRLLTGIGSAGANIPMMGLSSGWFEERRRGISSGLLVGGSGVAMLLSGWLVPALDRQFPADGWRVSWWVMGLLTLVFGILAARFIRNRPAETDASPSADGTPAPGERVLCIREILRHAGTRTLGLSYFCYGISFIIYTTFFVSFLVSERGVDPQTAGRMWAVVGLLSTGSAVLWGALSDRWGRPRILCAVFSLQAFSYLLPVLAPGTLLLWISSTVFGITAWSIPGLVAASSGDLVGPRNAPAALGALTFFFGIGTVAGPALAGLIKDGTSSFGGAFVLAAVFSLIGGLVGLRLLAAPPAPAGCLSAAEPPEG